MEKFLSEGTSDFSKLKDFMLHFGVKFVASDKEAYKPDSWDKVRENLLARGVPDEFVAMQGVVQ